MGARPQSFIEKMKVIIGVLKNEIKTPRTLVNCSNCKSDSITFESGKTRESAIEILYTSVYYCKKCGFECKNTQRWTKRI